MPWFVLYTKPKNEKKVADKLKAKGIDVYCPLIKVKRQWSDRIKTIEEPLFKSYCFVNLEERERANVFGVSGIVRYLFWQNKAAIVRDSEIDAIKAMLNEADQCQSDINFVELGSRFSINSGSFNKLSGTVVRQQGKIVSIILDVMQMVITVDHSKITAL